MAGHAGEGTRPTVRTGRWPGRIPSERTLSLGPGHLEPLASAEVPAAGARRGLRLAGRTRRCPPETTRQCRVGVSEGIRTPDPQIHNLVL